MTNSIGQTANTGAVAAAASTATTGAGGSATPAVSQQQFMQLLIAQLKHQDPTQPLQGTEFVTQLAQFSLVEQSANQTQQLTSLNAQIAGLTNDQASQLVGKNVTLNGSSLSFNGTLATPANALLAAPASSVVATITDASGNPVRTLNLGPHAAGGMTVPWDGRGDSGQVQPAGTYSVSVSATNTR